ncbi:MAG TPA: ATP synthase F1 subunit delta [Dehalococcoidia bacterium]|nr:ATP synthase F1 subunit delta [Dehalococcoidia bacterium]
MTRGVYARRYSQAVFNIALETNELDRWQSDLRKIASLADDTVFIAVLESPKFHFDTKTRLLSERLSDIKPLALNLVYLLVSRGRLAMVSDIADEYQCLLDSYRGIERVVVATAIPLDDEDKIRLAERLSAVVGKKVVLKLKVDSSLIGGIVARVGGKLLDGSTLSKLTALKEELAGVSKR